MDKEEIQSVLQKLREGEIESYRVTKEIFPLFREVIVQEEDMIHFRGEAKHKGDTIFTYEKDWTKNI